ncbi:MAG: ABC transporter permease subunit [Chloroflexota bacterium]
MNTFTITGLTFREAWRKKLLWMVLGLGLAFLVLFGIGFHFVIDEIRESGRVARQGEAAGNIIISQASGMLLILGLFAVNFLIVMMTALTSVESIAGEISSHTIQTLASKPISRWEIILGKWLGHALMLVTYIVFMVGGLTLIVYFKSGYWPPNLLQGFGLLLLEGLIVLSLTIFGGTIFSTLVNGVMVFMLYGIAFVGSWVEQVGATGILNSDTAVQVGIVASLIMPSEAMWRMASDIMQPPILRSLGPSPITVFSRPSNAMIVYALIYVVVLLGAALYQFKKRDL